MKGFSKINLQDMKNFKGLSKEQKRTFYVAVATGVVLLGGVGTTSVLAYQNHVQEEKIALEKKEYQDLVSDVKKAMDTAYDTRKESDITLVEKKIKGLNKDDKKTYTQKLTTLKDYLALIKKVDGLIAKAEQSKSDEDVASAQKGIDEEKADYLKNDKKAHQTKLDALKKTIADEKAKKAEEEKQAQEAAKAEAEKQAQSQGQASSNGASTSNGSAGSTAGGSYSSGGSAAQGGYSQPAQGGSSSAGSSSSNSSTGGFTLDYEYPGRISPYFLSQAEADNFAWDYIMSGKAKWDKGYSDVDVAGSSCSDGVFRYYVRLQY